MNPNQLVPERTNAIPCQYKGINFRSLLEARWAYFFDKLGWTWQYEPFEMDGYIPDFMLTHHLPFFVDIKPYTASDYKESVYNKVKEWNDKFVTDYKEFRYPVLFFNTVSFFNLPLFDRPNSELYQVCSLGDHQILVPEYICGNKAFIAENNVSSYDWYCGELINADGHDSDIVYRLPNTCLILKKDYDLFIEKLRKYWAEAQNATQYKTQKPQQFIQESAQESTQDSKESRLEIILPFGTKYSK